MSIWDDRYGRPGAPAYRGEPVNEPMSAQEFHGRLTDALRVVPLKGVLSPRSIDPRAVDAMQVVSTLRRGDYPGQQIRFRHTAGQAPWLCIWDPALNGGAGAWHVVGPAALLHGQSSIGDQSTASVSTWAAMTNTPILTVPPGVWDIDARGSVQQLGATAANGRVALRLNGTASDEVAAGWSGGDGQVATATRGPMRKTFTAATTITLAVATNNVTMRFGGPSPAGLWQLSVSPVELRP